MSVNQVVKMILGPQQVQKEYKSLREARKELKKTKKQVRQIQRQQSLEQTERKLWIIEEPAFVGTPNQKGMMVLMTDLEARAAKEAFPGLIVREPEEGKDDLSQYYLNISEQESMAIDNHILVKLREEIEEKMYGQTKQYMQTSLHSLQKSRSDQ